MRDLEAELKSLKLFGIPTGQVATDYAEVASQGGAVLQSSEWLFWHLLKCGNRGIESLNTWVETRGFPRGILPYDFADPNTGEQKAVFDLAWPNGIQEELSQPVAVLLNEGAETIGIASQAGFRCFTSVSEFKQYVNNEILAGEVQL